MLRKIPLARHAVAQEERLREAPKELLLPTHLGLEFDLFAADLRIATKLDEFIPR